MRRQNETTRPIWNSLYWEQESVWGKHTWRILKFCFFWPTQIAACKFFEKFWNFFRVLHTISLFMINVSFSKKLSLASQLKTFRKRMMDFFGLAINPKLIETLNLLQSWNEEMNEFIIFFIILFLFVQYRNLPFPFKKKLDPKSYAVWAKCLNVGSFLPAVIFSPKKFASLDF